MRRARESLAEMVSRSGKWTDTLTCWEIRHVRTGYSFDLSDEDAIDLGRRSIYAAGHRDVRGLFSPTAVFWLLLRSSVGRSGTNPVEFRTAQAFSGNTINLYSESILSPVA